MQQKGAGNVQHHWWGGEDLALGGEYIDHRRVSLVLKKAAALPVRNRQHFIICFLVALKCPYKSLVNYTFVVYAAWRTHNDDMRTNRFWHCFERMFTIVLMEV